MEYNGKQLMDNLYCDPHNFEAAICYLQSNHDHWKAMTRTEAENSFITHLENCIGKTTKINRESKTNEFLTVYKKIFATIKKLPPQTTGNFFPPTEFGYFFVQFYQVCS